MVSIKNKIAYRIVWVFVFTAVLTACSVKSKDIAASYVSPVQYQGYTCDQIAGEAARVQTRFNEIAGRLDQSSTNDKALVATGIIFWPVLFAVGGTRDQESQYARLRGEYDALQTAATNKKCSIMFAHP